MTDLPVIERHRLDELRALGELSGVPLVTNVLTRFLGDLPAHVRGVRDAIADADAAALKFRAHSLKSSSAQLGAAAMAAACLSLEHAALEAAPALFAVLEYEVARVTPLLVAERDAAS